MRTIITGSSANFTITIPRPDGMSMLIVIPKDKVWELKAEMEKNKQRQLMLAYPIGDFQKLAYKKRPYGERPRWETYNQVMPVPVGLVMEIVDVLDDERARSMPIPWEVFKELDNPIKELDLKW